MIDNTSPITPTAENLNTLEEEVKATAPEERGPPLGCIFVANIANETDEDSIRNVFTSYGEIMKLRLLKDRSARPYAFIQYKTVEAANQALLHGNKQVIDGKRLRTERAKVNRTLFIAKIDRNMTTAQLREMMERYGTIDSVSIIKNHTTNKSKGCGFVKYVYREDAMEAFTALKNDPHLHWVVEWATSNTDPAGVDDTVDKCNLFVGGLSPGLVTKELLEEKFKQYGTLENVTLINREMENAGSVAPTGSMAKSAYAFLRFTDSESAAKAMEHENGVEWLDKRKIRVQYCESQEQKNKRKQLKFNPPTPSVPLSDHGISPLLMDEMNLLNWHMGGLSLAYPQQTLFKQKEPTLSSAYASYLNYPINMNLNGLPLAYPNSSQWLLTQQQQQLQQQMQQQALQSQHLQQLPQQHLSQLSQQSQLNQQVPNFGPPGSHRFRERELSQQAYGGSLSHQDFRNQRQLNGYGDDGLMSQFGGYSLPLADTFAHLNLGQASTGTYSGW